jgi:3-hydroxyacyl-[acyl-carrier-protein] dehydratase
LKLPTTIEIDRILQILPHRWPFVMVDRVTDVVPKERIVGHKCVTMGEPWAQGHFPARPILPGVLIIEALAQIGGILAYASEPFDASSSLMYFLGIDKAKFRRPGRPPRPRGHHPPPPHERVEVQGRGLRRRDAVRQRRASRERRRPQRVTSGRWR